MTNNVLVTQCDAALLVQSFLGLSGHLSLRLSVHPSIHPSIHPSVWTCVSLIFLWPQIQVSSTKFRKIKGFLQLFASVTGFIFFANLLYHFVYLLLSTWHRDESNHAIHMRMCKYYAIHISGKQDRNIM